MPTPTEGQHGPAVPAIVGADNESKDAFQAVVDDNMRTDVLGPNFCKVLAEHIPTSDKLKAIMATAIESDGTVKKAIEVVLEGLDHKRKSKWVDRAIGAGGAIVLAVIIATATKYLLGQ